MNKINSREKGISLKNEEHYSIFFNATNDMAFLKNDDFKYILVNQANARFFDKSISEIIGKTDFDLMQESSARNCRKSDEEALKTESEIISEEQVGERIYETHKFRVPLIGGKFGIGGYIRDITERKWAEENLRNSEEHYRTLLTAIPDLMFRLDGKGRFIDFHADDISMLFAPPEKFLGKHYSEILPPDVIKKYENTIKKIKKTGEKGIFEYEALLANSNLHFYEARVTCYGDESILIVRDITEQKKILEALKASQERYRILIETMNEGLILVDNDDLIQFVNNRICKIFGYEPEEMIGRIGNEFMIIEEDRKIILEKNKLRKDKSVSDSYEVRAIKKNGDKIWININGAPVKDNEGTVIGSVGIITDITEKKLAEEELKKLSRAVEQSFASVVITDINGNIEYVNPKFVTLTGYFPEEVIGRNPSVLKSGDIPAEEYKKLWDTILSGNDWVGEFHNKKKNGELYWESAQISPVKNSDGEITHFIAIKEDITEKKLKEIELIQAKEKAEESERLKSSFLANMSHELRTPMVGILGFAELMKDMAENQEVKDFANNITKSGKRLLETLNLILDLSRIEAGKLEIKTSEVDIVQLTREVYENYIPEAAKKNIKITFGSDMGQIICKLDERMIWESINNVINNAIKYTKAGEVKVEVSTKNGKTYIQVKDTGIGIPKESLDTIFEEFRQVSEGYSRGFEGTGLGLTITKNFIVKNGGKIYVESEVGVGSIFTIELPVIYSERLKSEEKKIDIDVVEKKFIPERKEIKLLCVDDDTFTREYLGYILKNIYTISFAENGFNAIEMAKSQYFALILMDINLGKGMDGIETTRKIRKLPGYENVPVIAMTAFAMKGDREEFLNGGMKDYISKPFKSSELLKIIEENIQTKNS